jgi:hypothetical protein
MPSLKAAHIREQGQDMIIFPLDHVFGLKASSEQSEALAELEFRAHAAGLAGQAVAVWESGSRMHFLGPRPWHTFLQSINMRWVWANVNKEISWSD